MKQDFILLEKIIDDEINSYKELNELCKNKQSILVANKSDDLLEIDSKIINKFKSIKPIIDSRSEISNRISNSEMTLSEIIEKALNIDVEQSKRFKNKKEKINKLLSSIQETESINSNLISHGMKMIGKTIQIIFKNAKIPTNEYNNQGKITNQEKLQLSSVNEEV